MGLVWLIQPAMAGPAAVPASVVSAVPVAVGQTQAGVGPTGTMFNGNNVVLRVPDDGSVQRDMARTAPAAANQRIGGQEAGQSDTAAAGGGN